MNLRRMQNFLLRLETRIDRLAESTDKKIDEIMEVMRNLLVKSPASKKDSPSVMESTPSPVVLDTKVSVSNSVNLSAHMDEDNSPVKQAEEEKEENPVVVATVHFSAACTVPKQCVVVEAVEVSKLKKPRTLSLSEDTFNIQICAILDSIAVLFQVWPEISFSYGFPPGPPKKPPPWFKVITTSIVVFGQL